LDKLETNGAERARSLTKIFPLKIYNRQYTCNTDLPHFFSTFSIFLAPHFFVFEHVRVYRSGKWYLLIYLYFYTTDIFMFSSFNRVFMLRPQIINIIPANIVKKSVSTTTLLQIGSQFPPFVFNSTQGCFLLLKPINL